MGTAYHGANILRTALGVDSVSGQDWDHRQALERGRVMGALVPPPTVASPSDVPPQPSDALTPDFVSMFEGQDVPFWRPGTGDVLRSIGWRWFFIIPLAAFVLFIPLAALLQLGGPRFQFFQFSKLWLLAIGVIVTIVLSAVRRGVAARKGSFCIHCGYSLEGLADRGTCPECGRPYDTIVLAEFRKDPHFFMARYKAARSHPPGVAFAAGDGPTPDDGTR